jgi:hypothetical protein
VSSASGLPEAANRQYLPEESHMKRFVIATVLFTFIAGAFAAMAPASADPHGDRFKADCKSGARKC